MVSTTKHLLRRDDRDDRRRCRRGIRNQHRALPARQRLCGNPRHHIADTKFESAWTSRAALFLWTRSDAGFLALLVRTLRNRISPPSYDSIRAQLPGNRKGWDKRAPPPPLPPEVVAATAARYREALERLTGPVG